MIVVRIKCDVGPLKCQVQPLAHRRPLINAMMRIQGLDSSLCTLQTLYTWNDFSKSFDFLT